MNTTNKQTGHPHFYLLLDEMAKLHAAKNSDYATAENPLSNLRRCERINIPAWKGVIVRLTDKWDRIERLAIKKPDVIEESIRDTLMDNAVYSLLCIILLEEERLGQQAANGNKKRETG